MPPFWPFRRRRKPYDVARALEALKRRKAEEAARRANAPVPFSKGEVRELVHIGDNLRSHESWGNLRRHMEEHPGGGEMVDVGGGMELWATKPLGRGGRVFGLETHLGRWTRGVVPHMVIFDSDGRVIRRGETSLPGK